MIHLMAWPPGPRSGRGCRDNSPAEHPKTHLKPHASHLNGGARATFVHRHGSIHSPSVTPTALQVPMVAIGNKRFIGPGHTATAEYITGIKLEEPLVCMHGDCDGIGWN